MRRALFLVGLIAAVTLAARLLTSALGGGGITLPAFPTDWGITRFAGNPVIDVAKGAISQTIPIEGSQRL